MAFSLHVNEGTTKNGQVFDATGDDESGSDYTSSAEHFRIVATIDKRP
jgi:hypothetical protein